MQLENNAFSVHFVNEGFGKVNGVNGDLYRYPFMPPPCEKVKVNGNTSPLYANVESEYLVISASSACSSETCTHFTFGLFTEE